MCFSCWLSKGVSSVIHYYIQIVYKYVYTLNKILNVFFLIARLEIYLHDDDNSRRGLVSSNR